MTLGNYNIGSTKSPYLALQLSILHQLTIAGEYIGQQINIVKQRSNAVSFLNTFSFRNDLLNIHNCIFI